MSNKIFGFEIERAFDYENGFYLTSDKRRIQKLIAHYELYKKIINLPGAVVECGVFKGASLIRFAQFRDMLESVYSRKIIGFDIFGQFPRGGGDDKFISDFEAQAGNGIPVDELYNVLNKKGICNVELVKGDISKTIPEYVEKHKELRISLLHIDVDVYLSTKISLDHLYEHVIPGGLIVFDDYGVVEGETKAVDEFLAEKSFQLMKLPISQTPTYMIKWPCHPQT